MEPVIIGCDGCGIRIRIRQPHMSRTRACPLCRSSLDQRLSEELADAERLARPSPPVDGSGSKLHRHRISIHGPARRLGPASRLLTPLLAYMGAIVFLSITASLFAGALGSLGADEPDVHFGLRGAARACASGKKGRSEAAAACLPAAKSSTLADLPDDIFAPLPSLRDARPDDPDSAATIRVCRPQRIKIRDQDGRVIVARFHGEHEGQSTFILPDGQLGIPTRHFPTDEPFRPLSADELHDQLKDGLFSEFRSFRTDHYLIFSQSKGEGSLAFARRSGALLENLHRGLTETFRKRGIPLHDVEFPLVVVIFESEKEFRAHKQVAPDVQAYYEIFTNRIYFYETSDEDHLAPEIATLRKPQTVAHEGTHQILANIGVQPRLGAWPVWLTEGLAEYCASPVHDHRGNVVWNGLGRINALHMATIRDLEDPRAMQVKSRRGHVVRTGRDPGKPLVESLIRAEELSPTDYALAWALTHYLALMRGDDFVKFLVEMGKIPPLETRTAEDHLAAFKKAFGNDLAKMDKEVARYLAKLAKQKGYDDLRYYAVMFEQAMAGGTVRRAAMVSQSPSMIQQWIQEMSSPRGAAPSWHLLDHPTRGGALRSAEEFMQGF